MAAGKHINDDSQIAARLSADFENLIASIPSGGTEKAVPTPATTTVAKRNNPASGPAETVVSAPTPIVRVSLDRLDDLLNVSRSLLANRSAIAEQFAAFKDEAAGSRDAGSLAGIDGLIDTQQRLADEILKMLMQIRMVRFGTLEMRLNRAVHVTCQEEGKQAFVVMENADIEIDTQVIDALIEPLLHLLKNAVVHGIEPTETRRLLGKSEKGRICIAVQADETNVFLAVSDDGRGISTAKLTEKALASGIIDEQQAASMDEQSIVNLIFNRGLTTAESLNLNAGRGVGMSIVKESVESRGGIVTVESGQQKGTKFTIRMPHALPKPEVEASEPKFVEPAFEPDADVIPLVLIVDDSKSIRRMTAKIVEDAGLRTITAENGAEALELLLSGEWKPDIILSDVEMPVMDGWEFLEYVKTDDNFGEIPVIMVTSLSSDEHREKAAGLGAADYMVKPFSIAELDRVLENLGNLASA
jgi:CheY-like chemotaxis protein/two-component sensor histidine kinase